MNSEKALAKLLAKDAIETVLNRYARGVDSADLETIRSAYWPEGTDDHGNYSGNAHEFAVFAIEVLKNFRVTMHFLTNVEIEIVDDRWANAECYFYAYHEQHPDPEGGVPMVTLVGGRYIDRFECRDGEWRILARKVTMDWDEHRPGYPMGDAATEVFSEAH